MTYLLFLGYISLGWYELFFINKTHLYLTNMFLYLLFHINIFINCLYGYYFLINNFNQIINNFVYGIKLLLCLGGIYSVYLYGLNTNINFLYITNNNFLILIILIELIYSKLVKMY